jgi:hypothetical protein
MKNSTFNKFKEDFYNNHSKPIMDAVKTYEEEAKKALSCGLINQEQHSILCLELQDILTNLDVG